ncbi:MAG: biotin/lipoyl-binding protein [Oscillospiraceae bacterium]|nr:biotin/lipoyl-binding protein [Oscillospiraceae bacterium]
METNVKKREWVKTVAIIFLAVMLVLTFFSNTIMNHSLPEVATANVTSGTINAKIRGQGTVSANETYDVTIKQTRKVASIKVKAGQEVAAGDVLFTLEAEESDELKQAQTDLESMELNYEKSLIAASTEAARENREVQKLQETYNDLLAQYHQYSNKDASQIAKEKAAADAKLKELQADSKAAQSDYEARVAEKTELESEAAELKTHIASLKAVMGKQEEIIAAQNTLYQDQIRYLNDYNRLMELAGQNPQVAMSYARYPEQFANMLTEQDLAGTTGDSKTADPKLARAQQIATAYTTLTKDQSDIDSLTAERDNMIYDIDGVRDYSQVESEYRYAYNEYDAVKRELDSFDSETSRLKKLAEDAAQAVIDQQEVVDKLASAGTLADQVKSAKQALEDKIFEQSLSDGSSLDLEAAKKAIDEKKADIEKLTQNADETEVKAKVAGTVSNIAITAGSNANAETPLITLNLTDRGYTVKISVTNDQAKKVRVGDNAELVNYWYGGDIQATLENITNDPQNPGKGRLLVFRLTGDVEPDTNLTLSIGQKSANYDCIVPNSAVRTDSNGTFVLAITVKSSPLGNRYTATRVDVQELAKDDTNTAVTGLSSGDFVITTSTKPIEAGTQVRLVDNG